MLGYKVVNYIPFHLCGVVYRVTVEAKGIIFMATTIISAIQVLAGIVLIVFVLGQSGKHSGLGTIGGASESFLSKNQAKSMDAKLARWTKWVALVFVVLTLALSLMPH